MMNDIEKYDYIEKEYGASYFKSTNIVLELLNDSDECVRMEMIEACYACEQEIIQEKLFQMLQSTNGLEKGYVLLTLAYIYQDNQERIVDILRENILSSDVYEKMDAFIGLVILGYKDYVKDIFKFLEADEYTVRCASANMLVELIQNEFIQKDDIIPIQNDIYQISQKEKTQAAKSSIQHLLEIIKNVIEEK